MQRNDLKISSRNAFDERYDKFIQSNRAKKLADKFKDRTFDERTKKLFILALVVSLSCTVFSGYSEHYYLLKVFDSMVSHKALSIILLVVVILAIEYGKRDSIPTVFKEYFQYKTVNKTALSVSVLLIVSSVFLSFEGAKLIPSEGIPGEANLINVDSIQNYYDTEISNIENQIETQSKSTWKGKIVKTALSNIGGLNEQKLLLLSEKKEVVEKAENENVITLSKFEAEQEQKGLNIGYATMIAEILLLLCIGFIEYRDYRAITQFADIENHESSEVTNTEVEVEKQGNKNSQSTPHQINARNEIKLYGTSSRASSEELKTCLYCDDKFKPKNKVHKYCSTECRKSAYESRTGRKLRI